MPSIVRNSLQMLIIPLNRFLVLFIPLNFFHPHNNRYNFHPILQLRKLKHNKAKKLSHGQLASSRNPSLKYMLLTIILCASHFLSKLSTLFSSEEAVWWRASFLLWYNKRKRKCFLETFLKNTRKVMSWVIYKICVSLEM